MSKLLVIGSSNIRNLVDGHRSSFEKGGIKCDFRSASAFTTGLKTLQEVKSKSYVVAAFLVNGLVDATTDESNFAPAISVVNTYANAIIEISLKTDSYIWILRPMQRQTPGWIAKFIPEAVKILETKISHIKNIKLLPQFDVTPNMLKLDGVHLNQAGLDLLALHFHKNISLLRGLNEVSSPVKRKHSNPNNASDSKKAAPEAVAMPGIVDPQLQLVVQSLSNEIRTSLAAHKEETGNAIQRAHLRIDITLREVARQAESADNAINLAKAHILLINGLEGQVKQRREERNHQVRNVALAFLERIGLDRLRICYATFLSGTKPGSNKLPLIRVVLRSVGAAHEVREAFTKARIDKPELYKDIYINPEHTKATRVRIAIMQIIARKAAGMPEYKDHQVYVSKFEPCPELCFRNRATKQFEGRLSFVDAVEKLAGQIGLSEFDPAKRVAGRSFPGRLNTLFLIWGKSDEQK